MKNIIVLLMIALAPLHALAQSETQGNLPDSAAERQDTLPDNDEAGGIAANEVKTDAPATNWMYLLAGAVAVAVVSALATRALIKGKTTPALPVAPAEPEIQEAEPKKDTKGDTAENKKLKAEIKSLTAQLQELQQSNATLDRNLEIYRNFDSGYFNEAFRKLIAPMNEAMEKGSEREILENLVKIMGHFSSLTRYKISKKQPYDEANIHYLLNQKAAHENLAVDITGDTPLDKIPKNIKTILDLLKQQQSKGLDDSVIAGYRIKNL